MKLSLASPSRSSRLFLFAFVASAGIATAAACATNVDTTAGMETGFDAGGAIDAAHDAATKDAGTRPPPPEADAGDVDAYVAPPDPDSGGPGIDAGVVDMDAAAPPPVDANVPVDASTPVDAGVTGDCGAPPTLHPSNGSTLYCPFGASGPLACSISAGKECCINPKVNGSYPPSTCDNPCPISGATALACEAKADCASGVCCGTGTINHDAVCNDDFASGFSGTACASSCAAGQLQICGAQIECPAGKTCVPFKAKGLDLGYCR